MIISFFNLRYVWVFSSQDSKIPLGKIYDVIINPENLIILAFWIRTPRGLKVLLVRDILFFNGRRVEISSVRDLAEARGIPALNKIFAKECPIINAKVYAGKTKKSRFIGVVKDFLLNSVAPTVLNIRVKKGCFFFAKNYLISRAKIHKVTKKGVFLTGEAFLRPIKWKKINLGRNKVIVDNCKERGK